MARVAGIPEIARAADNRVHRTGAAHLIAASVLVMLALAAPLYELKPNRIAAGLSIPGRELVAVAAMSIALLALFVVIVFMDRARHAAPASASGTVLRGYRAALYLLWASAWLPVAVAVAVIGSVASMDISGPAGSAGLQRVSPAPGFWLLVAGSALAGRWARRALGPPRAIRVLAAVAAMAALALALRFGMFDRFSPFLELKAQGSRFAVELQRHVVLSVSAFGFALVAGVAGAVLLSRGKRAGRILGAMAGVIQNIPSLALFGLLLPVMAALAARFPALRAVGISGIGFAPAFVALAAYALLPVMLSGAAGLRMVDPGARDAAKGMGMSAAQILFRVELPLALPAIAAGARTALVQTIGTATVAALIGAGGMGYFVFQGTGQAAMDMVIIGVVPIVALSVGADALMAALGPKLASKGGAQWR